MSRFSLSPGLSPSQLEPLLRGEITEYPVNEGRVPTPFSEPPGKEMHSVSLQ